MSKSLPSSVALAATKNVAVVVMWVGGALLLCIAAIDWLRYTGFLLMSLWL